VIVHIVHVVMLDALIDFREQARLLPREGGALGGVRGIRGRRVAAVGHDTAWQGRAESQDEPCNEGEQRA
jgi:hypothetical protein